MANTVITFRNDTDPKKEQLKNSVNKEIYKDISLVSKYGKKLHT